MPLTNVARPGPLHEAVPEHVQAEEDRELGDQRHGADGGENAVLPGEGAGRPRQEAGR